MGYDERRAQFHEAFLDMVEFFKTSEHVTAVTNQADVVIRCYELLRIGKLCVHIRNHTSVNGPLGEYSTIVAYDSGKEDTERVIQKEKFYQDEKLACYTIYQIEGQEDWTEDELRDIDMLVHVNFLFNSRSRLVVLMERARYLDKDFEIPNIQQFMQDVNKFVDQERISEYGTCRFNVKNLKYINAQIGFLMGTSVLKKYITNIQDFLGENGTVYRVGGDNFIVMYKQELFEQLRDMLLEHDMITGVAMLPEIKIGSRAGYYFPMDIDTADTVIRNTNECGLLAKQLKYEDYMIYNEGQRVKQRRMQEIVKDANRGFINEEFIVYYQPKMNSKNNRLIGAEALCRWMREGQMVSPDRFIPVLEQSNDICKLDFYMLEHVCRDLRRWIDTGFEVVRISVNFSRVNLTNADFTKKVIEIIDRYKVPHEYIAVELTETAIDVSFETLAKVVNSLNEAGVCTSVDDFGIGYSSLNIIRDLPWKVLKLDRSFLPLPDDKEYEQKKIMLSHMISMVQALGLQCIAEGAEVKEQIDLLAECGCYFIQGYYYDKPLPKEEFEKRLSLGDD